MVDTYHYTLYCKQTVGDQPGDLIHQVSNYLLSRPLNMLNSLQQMWDELRRILSGGWGVSNIMTSIVWMSGQELEGSKAMGMVHVVTL